MRKLQIILDSDEVIVESIEKLLNLYNQEYGLNLKKEQIDNWNLSHFEKEGTDIQKYFNMPGYFRDLPLIKDAKKYIYQMVKDGHDIVIATSSPKNGILDKIEFFEEHFPFIPYQNVIPITRKDLLFGDIMLDDAPHNLEHSKCKHPVIFDNRWNRDVVKYPFLKNLKRVASWKEFYEFVCEVANKKMLMSVS